ncbi:uncharacterized protein LOC108928812 [Scleropages formosus]|uniref:uncharacterized protein LOC108928812 n=1 Tax=Scleropages formosus TaxID=113540 RepID=UPI0010FA6511|nr:uncharacterized protein LOC108928812 [Scleropages formosus]
MAQLNFPVPELEVTLREARRVLQLILSPEQFQHYENILSQQAEVLQEAHSCLASAASERENWVTEQFKSRLLSCADPLPTSTAIPAVLPPSKFKGEGAQARRAAALLWAVAKLYGEPLLIEADGLMERTQQSEVFAASRLPGKTQDQIKVYPDSLHAILICQAGVFQVQILARTRIGGPFSPLPFSSIYSQVLEVMNQPKANQDQDPAPVCGFSALPRQVWHDLREQILSRGGAAAVSLRLMESAILALALEDFQPPADLAQSLNIVRLGGGDGPSLRYYDKVMNLVVFQDSTAGMVFEHCALDGMVAGLVAETLALRKTLGDSANSHILVTPTHMRHYKHGRCDPTYSCTAQSRLLVEALMSRQGTRNAPENTKDLFRLFHQAFQEHKHLIKNTKSGQGVGPHLAALRWAMSQDNPLRKFMDPFSCPSVYLTGKDLMEGVECAVGNVYACDQLAVTYLGKRDLVRLVLNGKGSFAESLGQLQENLKGTLKLVMLLALKYAIAGEMGATECWLGEGEVKVGTMSSEQSGSQKDLNKNKTSYDLTANMKSDFTLVIHGGAGKEMMLNQKVIDVIEFSLQSALLLGKQELAGGGSSLDTVQRCVTALEDCFLFNAGKGSVFNREGKLEMEATIVDGSGMNSGSVACVQTVKNPIKAARQVMKNSRHALLVGDGAEQFLDSLEEKEKPVDLEYFHTDLRYKELEMKRKASKDSSNNHPQTVGAVALDRCRRLAAATSSGGLVGKWKGRVGDTSVMGAGIFSDTKLAVTCSGDGDVFLKHTVAHKVASLYHHKGYSLREACREVISEHLEGCCAGIIAVDVSGEVAIETNAGTMFVGSVIDGIIHAEVLRPTETYSNVIWETDELVAYLHSAPWTPGATVLTLKNPNRPCSVFHLQEHDYLVLLLGAKAVAHLLCEKLGVQRCALVFKPRPGQPAHIRVLPLHGLEPNWTPQHAEEEDFQPYDPGYCSSKSGPRWEDVELKKLQHRIRSHLPNPDSPFSYHFLGDPSHDNLFSRIVRGEEHQWRVWENGDHVAFLTPYPNTPGLTVLVPRQPLSSDIFRLDEDDYKALVLASREVAQLLERGMGAHGVALIFEGYEVDYAHAKLIPLLLPPGNSPLTTPPVHQFCQIYQGYVTSADGPPASVENLKEIRTKITQCKPPQSWEDPQKHAALAINSQWYRNLFKIQNTLFHATVEFFHTICRYAYALTPLTTDTISSPMGLGSDSEPVCVNVLGQDVYLADSMQFVLEYFLRFQEGLPGAYYVSPSFRGEDPDATHLNQFYHVECELLGSMDTAMQVAENYLVHLTRAMLKKHSDIILRSAGTVLHARDLLEKLDGQKPLPRVTLEQALSIMPSEDCMEWVQDGEPQFGRNLTRKGEQVLIEMYGGAVWLTDMDHLGVPFYQAYVEGSGRCKAKAADLLLGLGETIGLGERHSTPGMVQEALRHHAVPEDSYRWYINMRQAKPLLTSGWGMGTERYLCWLLKHNDVRDMHIIPRMKAKKYMP